MRRRTYLIGGLAALTSIAGCGSPGAGINGTGTSPDGMGTDTGTEPPIGSPTKTEESSPTGTEEASPTETEATSPTQTATGTETAGTMQTVELVAESDAFYFDPIGLAVDAGTTVEWTIASGDHSTTAYEDRIPDAAEAWDSGVLTEDGATFTRTFETEGTYDYFCTPHRTQGMVARIVVGQPGGPAEGSMPPDGDVPESQRIVDEGAVSYADFTAG